MTNGQGGTAHSISRPPDALQDVNTVTIDRQKIDARAQARHRRDAAVLSDPSGRAALALRDRVLDAIPWPAGGAVSAYWPMGSEIDTRPLIEALHARGHAIGLPVMLGKGEPLIFRTWEPGLTLIPGGFGTLVPGPDRPELRPQVLLVPLLAFDRRGFRLGYGGGFYDRTLAAIRPASPVLALGLAYSAQEVDKVPHDDHDQRLDWIVTEAASHRAQGAPA